MFKIIVQIKFGHDYKTILLHPNNLDWYSSESIGITVLIQYVSLYTEEILALKFDILYILFPSHYNIPGH